MLEEALWLIFCSVYVKTRNDTFWMQNFFFFTGKVLNASHLQSVRSHTGGQNNSKVFSLKSFHCQQWTWQQEHLIACKTISYSNKCGTHLHAQREGGSSLPRMYRIPTGVWAAHTQLREQGNHCAHIGKLVRDPAELLLQHCWVETRGAWCSALRHVLFHCESLSLGKQSLFSSGASIWAHCHHRAHMLCFLTAPSCVLTEVCDMDKHRIKLNA